MLTINHFHLYSSALFFKSNLQLRFIQFYVQKQDIEFRQHFINLTKWRTFLLILLRISVSLHRLLQIRPKEIYGCLFRHMLQSFTLFLLSWRPSVGGERTKLCGFCIKAVILIDAVFFAFQFFSLLAKFVYNIPPALLHRIQGKSLTNFTELVECKRFVYLRYIVLFFVSYKQHS